MILTLISQSEASNFALCHRRQQSVPRSIIIIIIFVLFLIKIHNILLLLAGFALFRLFDIWKPPPIRQSQNLAGGWGVTVDDLLAAVYVNIVLQGAWLVVY